MQQINECLTKKKDKVTCKTVLRSKSKYSITIRKDSTTLYLCMKPHTMREGSVTNYHKEQVDRIFFLCNMYWSKEYCRVLLCTYKMYIPLNFQKKGPTKDWGPKKVTIYFPIFYLVKSSENILFFYLHFT